MRLPLQKIFLAALLAMNEGPALHAEGAAGLNGKERYAPPTMPEDNHPDFKSLSKGALDLMNPYQQQKIWDMIREFEDKSSPLKTGAFVTRIIDSLRLVDNIGKYPEELKDRLIEHAMEKLQTATILNIGQKKIEKEIRKGKFIVIQHTPESAMKHLEKCLAELRALNLLIPVDHSVANSLANAIENTENRIKNLAPSKPNPTAEPPDFPL
ncbi:MAG: hypothetical protein IT558_03045 [Alphaproteobacteria bacterium]|nr:hypothetical protein [Alphaproteobacteria bacterium]